MRIRNAAAERCLARMAVYSASALFATVRKQFHFAEANTSRLTGPGLFIPPDANSNQLREYTCAIQDEMNRLNTQAQVLAGQPGRVAESLEENTTV